MSQNLILLPVAAQVLLTSAVLLATVVARGRSMRETGKTAQDLALATAADWTPAARQASNNYSNQFELPVLFYAVTAFALIARMADAWMIGLAWIFVASRVVHSVVHLTSNIVRWRGPVFVIGFVTLLVMWGLLVWRVAQAGF